MSATSDYGGPPRVAVTLKRSVIGQPPKARGTVRALGLRRIGTRNELTVTRELIGMLHRVQHLVRVEPVSDSGKTVTVHARQVELSESSRRITKINGDKDTVAVSFMAGMKVKQADARLHDAMDDLGPIHVKTIVWDEGTGQVREFEGKVHDRPLLHGDRYRLALVRFDSDSWMIGMQPPLGYKPSNVEINVLADASATETVIELVKRVAGPDLAEEARKEMATKIES